MPGYACKIGSIVTGTGANTYTTIASFKFADTAGHVGRLRRLVVGGGGGASEDVPVSVQLKRSDNSTAGTSTSVNVNTIGPMESLAIASNVSAIGKTYTSEPTTVESATLGGGEFNSRGTLVLEWGPGEGPKWGRNETLLVQGAPGTATAVKLGVEVEWDE